MDGTVVKPHFSIPSIVALAAAIASFFVAPGLQFILALVAIVFGVIGLILSFSPSIRGGIISTFSLVVAAIGIVVAIIRAIESFRRFGQHAGRLCRRVAEEPLGQRAGRNISSRKLANPLVDWSCLAVAPP
jgi:hypothetical protein